MTKPAPRWIVYAVAGIPGVVSRPALRAGDSGPERQRLELQGHEPLGLEEEEEGAGAGDGRQGRHLLRGGGGLAPEGRHRGEIPWRVWQDSGSASPAQRRGFRGCVALLWREFVLSRMLLLCLGPQLPVSPDCPRGCVRLYHPHPRHRRACIF